MSSSLGSCTRFEIVFTKKVEQVRALQLHRLVRFALFVHQQRKRNACLLTKSFSVGEVAKADGCKCRAALSKCFFACAQLRDMLAAEDSTVMAQENDDRRLPQPKRTEPNCTPVAIGQVDHGKPAVECPIHAFIVSVACRRFKPQHSLCRAGSSSYLGNSGIQDAKLKSQSRLAESAPLAE